ncbi:MAG: hypothetical protein FWE67_14650, partial [Planctomycetaceae bacterium]|nr:hypothetical protein [Planctomycetaceae bacterium]
MGNDMVLVNETVYGHNGECSSCGGAGQLVLAQIVHPGDGKTRVTEYKYDWCGRRTHTLGEEDGEGNSVQVLTYYDNLDRAVKSEQYLVSENSKSMRLLSRSESLTDARGRTYKTVRSAVNPKTGETEHRRESHYWFDAKGRSVRQAEPSTGIVNETVYDSLGYPIMSKVSVNKTLIRSSENVYDKTGKLLHSIAGEKQNGRKGMRYRCSSRWYDAAGHQIASAYSAASEKPVERTKRPPEKSAHLRLSKTIYDKRTGRIEKSIDAAGREQLSQFDHRGNAVKSFRKRTVKFIRGKRTFISNPEQELLAETVYNVAGQMTAQIDALGNKTEFVYDAFGRQIARIDALGNKTQFVYNNIGELLEQIDPLGRSTKFEYDNFGRRVKTILPSEKDKPNPVQETVYNALGQIIKQIDPLGLTVSMEYNSSGRVIRQTDAEGGVTVFAYNGQGQLLSLTDPVDNTTSYEYDEQGRQVKETNALGLSRYIEYAAGNAVAKKTDRNGRVTVFEYDDWGQRTAEKWYSGDECVKTIAFTYNETGQLVSVDDGITKFDYTRDEDGREVAASVLLPGLKNPIVFETEYDILGRRIDSIMNVDAKTEMLNSYTYSKTGQMLSITQNNKRVDYAYDAAGQRTSARLLQSGREVVSVSQSYDAAGHLKNIVQKHGNQTIA